MRSFNITKQYSEAITFFENLLKDKNMTNKPETLRTMSTLGKAYCLAGRNKKLL